ncbi:OpgC domain-containing protein [Sulfitobacter sp. LCG007]
MSTIAQTRSSAKAPARVRDPRLDFFRGLAMFIILVAHTPQSWFPLVIPARFGFSDATEIFVFCSGMASAIAFGSVFRKQGWWMGTARVAFRCWQVYWAHIGTFLAIAAAAVAMNASGLGIRDYVEQLNLGFFFNDTPQNLVGLLTLTYVPNYFDILPMYLIVLAMMPFVVACYKAHPALALALVVGVWIAAQFNWLEMRAEPWSDREWFFNPFGWQLVFFTGFAFMSGWLPKPPRNRELALVAAVIVVVTVPFAYYRIISAFPAIDAWRIENDILIAKTDFGILRYVHFLALAYLCWVAVGKAGHRILPPTGDAPLAAVWRHVLAWIMKVGQQSLAVFITSMFLARVLGLALDMMGSESLFNQVIVLFSGFAILIVVAQCVGWFKSQPWRRAQVAK